MERTTPEEYEYYRILYEFLEDHGFWITRAEGFGGERDKRLGNTRLMKFLKESLARKNDFFTQELKEGFPEIYKFLIEIPLEDTPLYVNDPYLQILSKFRLKYAL